MAENHDTGTGAVSKSLNGSILTNLQDRIGDERIMGDIELMYIDDYTTTIFIIVQYCIVSTLTNLFGIVTNTISIIIFIKNGFGESINISLLGLAISDLSSLVTLQWINICFSPMMQYSDLPFISTDLTYLTGAWPRIAFTRITGWITAFIAFERCVCIAMPLKARMIITPRRTAVVVVAIFICILASVTPSYYTSRLVWKFVPERNRTILGLDFTYDRQKIDQILFAFCNVFLLLLALIIITVCTIILTIKLNSKTKWRETSTAGTSQQISIKDKKIVKMVTLISTVFIVCFLPNAIVFAAMASKPELNLDGRNRNLTLVAGAFSVFFESLNSITNIFFYLRMSSKFRVTFQLVFYSTNSLKAGD